MYFEYIKQWKETLKSYYSQISTHHAFYEKFNSYFYSYRRYILKKLIPDNMSVLELGCGTGDNLASLSLRKGVGVDISPAMITIAEKKFPGLNFICADADELTPSSLGDEIPDIDYIYAINLMVQVPDIYSTLKNISKLMQPKTRLVLLDYSYYWDPLIRLYAYLSNKIPGIKQNRIHCSDYRQFFSNSGFKVIRHSQEMIFPFYIPFFSNFINRIFRLLPLINKLGMIRTFVLSRQIPAPEIPEMSCSVIIPCKNEEQNVELILPRMPKMGKKTEIVFIDDQSTDQTWEKMLKQKDLFKDRFDVKVIKGPGKGKGAACREGFDTASGDVFMILDADMTVAPETLPDFFNILQKGYAEFVNGSRQVYRMEEKSMKFMNKIGNNFFSCLFSWLMETTIYDTLCGTKAWLKRDYPKILETRKLLEETDIWGDYDLLFTASKYNLSLTEYPVHYFERQHGVTKMTKRFRNGFIMLRCCWKAFKILK